MSKKTMYYIAVFVGSVIFSYIPKMWGADMFSISVLLFGTLGSILGIVFVYKYL